MSVLVGNPEDRFSHVAAHSNVSPEVNLIMNIPRIKAMM